MGLIKENIVVQPPRRICEDVGSPEEAEVLVGMLEVVLTGSSVSAPEISLFKKAAIIRSPDFSIDLINPVITKAENKIISYNEECFSFPGKNVNCIRWNEIELQNGFDKKRLIFTGKSAILIQHEMDHFNEMTFYDRAIKLAIVKEGGEIRFNSFCPCGSKKRFVLCCMRNQSI
jgi:peptide deformylase